MASNETQQLYEYDEEPEMIVDEDSSEDEQENHDLHPYYLVQLKKRSFSKLVDLRFGENKPDAILDLQGSISMSLDICQKISYIILPEIGHCTTYLNNYIKTRDWQRSKSPLARRLRSIWKKVVQKHKWAKQMKTHRREVGLICG